MHMELHNHRVNAMEPVVRYMKYHKLTSFATLDPNCLIQLWCKFIEEIEITLNILRKYPRDNSTSAYEDYHNGKFD